MAARNAGSRSAVGSAVQAGNLPVLLTIAVLVIGTAALLPLIQSGGVTSRSGEVRALQQEKTNWQAQIRELELELAAMGSLDRIEQEAAKRFKMGRPEVTHYIPVDAPAPEPRRLPSRFLPQQTEQRRAGSSLWEDLFGWLPLP